MTMIKNKNFEEVLGKSFKRKEFVAFYKSAVDNASENHEVVFYQNMAILIGQIGYKLDECLASPKIKSHTTYGSNKLICIDLLHDGELKFIFDQLNTNSNIVKHSTNGVIQIGIGEVLFYYNNMIQRLSNLFKSDAIRRLKIYPQSSFHSPAARPSSNYSNRAPKPLGYNRRPSSPKMAALKPIAPKKPNPEATKKYEVFEMIGKHKLNIRLDNAFKFDKYEKVYKGELIIKSDDKALIEDTFDVSIIRKKGDKDVKFNIGNNLSIKPAETIRIPLIVQPKLIKNNRLELALELDVHREITTIEKKEHCYHSGWWIFGSDHYYTTDEKKVENKMINTKRISLATIVRLS